MEQEAKENQVVVKPKRANVRRTDESLHHLLHHHQDARVGHMVAIGGRVVTLSSVRS